MQVRITSVNKVRNYISYAVALLEEKGHSSVILKAMGQAINKAVVVGETQPGLLAGMLPDKLRPSTAAPAWQLGCLLTILRQATAQHRCDQLLLLAPPTHSVPPSHSCCLAWSSCCCS